MDNDHQQLQVAVQFKNLAIENLRVFNFPTAFFHTINCLRVLPEWRHELREMFLQILTQLGQILESKKEYEELFSIYREALRLYNDSTEIHHNLGAHLLRLGYPNEAVYYFNESLARDNLHLPAFQNLQSALCCLVERWHYRMLNDAYRNEAFKTAICKRIRSGFDTVLDIGTGTGLFCLYAEEGKAKRIYACEHNPTMLDIANKICTRSSSSIKLIPKHSNKIHIPNDIPERVSLVVTETMDACILGEHMLDSLVYAWKNLLQPSGVVIPHSGCLKFAVVQSKQLVKDYLYPLNDTSPDDFSDVFAKISLDNVSTPEHFRELRLAVELRSYFNEPYDTERLQFYRDCNFLTSDFTAFDVNFNSLTEIESFLSQNEREFRIHCSRDGYAHAIVAWFEVKLDDEVILSSAPNGENSKYCCWDQAIFPCPKEYRMSRDSSVTVINKRTADNKVTFDIANIVNMHGHVISDNRTLPKSISLSCISMLNDYQLLAHLKYAAMEFLTTYKPPNKIQILDLFPIPIFGLTVLCNQHMIPCNLEKVELVCVIATPNDQDEIIRIAHNNGIPVSCLSFILSKEFHQKIINCPMGYFNAIVLNVVKSEGLLDEELISHISFLEKLSTEGGFMLPKKIEIVGQLIYSDYLERSMRVVNEDVLRCGIGHEINKYQVSQILEINQYRFPYEAYSHPFSCATFKLNELDSKTTGVAIVETIRQGNVNSILLWYRICFTSDSGREYSTSHEFAHVHQSAFLNDKEWAVDNDCTFFLSSIYHHGAFRISLPSITEDD